MTHRFLGYHILALFGGLMVAFALRGHADAATFTSLASFPRVSGSDISPDGLYPSTALVMDAADALYGAATQGGVGGGTVFRVTPPASGQPRWRLDPLYRFRPDSEGVEPQGPLALDRAGNIFGIINDPAHESCSSSACFNVFELTPPTAPERAWRYKVTAHFDDSRGTDPAGGLVMDSSGALYGVTQDGAAHGSGGVYKLTPATKPGAAWTYDKIYSFKGTTDGFFPEAGVAVLPSGALIGTNAYGGWDYGNCSAASGYFAGCGTVFELSPPTTGQTAWTESTIHTFTMVDGAHPTGPLIADATGALYGATEEGGLNGAGTVFKLTPPSTSGRAWTLTTLVNLMYVAEQEGPLVFDQAGALWGTSLGGGYETCQSGCGTLFKVSPPTVAGGTWTESEPVEFTKTEAPGPGLIVDSAGHLYGTLEFGGVHGVGDIFELIP